MKRILTYFLIILIISTFSYMLMFYFILEAELAEKNYNNTLTNMKKDTEYLTLVVQEERLNYEEERQNRIYWKNQYFSCIHEQTDRRTIVELIE